MEARLVVGEICVGLFELVRVKDGRSQSQSSGARAEMD